MKLFIAAGAWLLCSCSYFNAAGQNFYNTWYYNYDLVWEGSAGAGLMNCLTDIGGRKGNGAKFWKDIQWRCSKPALHLSIGATYKDLFSLRLNWQSGSVNAADSLLKDSDPDPAGRYGRNLSFSSTIRELSLLSEMHPLFWKIGPQDQVPLFSPYIIAGFSYYQFNPRTFSGGQWYELHPLHLEGQGFPVQGMPKSYQLTQVAIPLGAGLRYETGPLFNLRFDCIYRLLFTDHLDDVSTKYIDPSFFDQYLDAPLAAIAQQLYYRADELNSNGPPTSGSQRGNAKNRDAFFSFQFSVCYVFRYRVK